MKKVIAILILFIGIMTNAQEKRTVTSTGSAIIKRETTHYRIKATLNMDQAYYSDPQCKSLEEFKEKYFNALRENGFDPKAFEESKMEFLTLGYQKEGTILKFETTSKEMAEILMSVRMNGITLQYQFKSVLSPEKRNELRTKALADARANAEQLCEISGGTLGAIMNISESAPRPELWSSYYDSYEELLTLSVSFQLN
jgi:hypothetical protein